MSRKSKFGAMFEAIEFVREEDSLVIEGDEAENTTPPEKNLKHILLTKIYVNPSQVRKYFDPDEQEKLKNTIQKNGFQGAILLRPLSKEFKIKVGNTYEFELIYGESRFRAVQDLGHETIPSIVRKLTDSQMRRIRLDENLVRKELNPLEEVEGLLEIAADELGISTGKIISLLDEVANAAKRNKELTGINARQAEQLQEILNYYKKGTLSGFRTKLRKLQRLPDDIRKAVQEKLSWAKATEIAPVKDMEIRKKLLEWAIEDNPSLIDIRKRRKELTKLTDHGNQLPANDSAIKIRFYRGLAKISKSEEWANPRNKARINHLIQEIEDIFHIQVS